MARKRSDSTGSATANAGAEGGIDSLLDYLTFNVEEVRRLAAAALLDGATPFFLGVLADGLVDRLTSRNKEVRQAAAASLVQMGMSATVVLYIRLHRARDKALRKRLRDVFIRIAQTLPEAEGART